MNRYDADSNFDDALGHKIRWSLRGSVSNAAPSAEVWARIKQQVCAGKSATESKNLAARPRRWPRAAAGRLLCLGAASLRFLDEHTMSSELAWRPEPESDLRHRLALQCISSLPLCGQMLAPY